MSSAPAELRQRLAKVRLLVVDVDGVLTDGRLRYGADGESIKAFNAKDGLGLRLLMEQGIHVGVITARRGGALARRMRDLKISHFRQGRDDKSVALDELLAELDLTEESMAYAGDDLIDLPVLRRAGVAISVADGHHLVRKEVDWVTEAAGGAGAVREIADALLEARDALHSATDKLLASIAERSARAEPGFRVVIPARYGASRLPGKPLRELAGRPMVAHVWERGTESGADEVIVAADDQRIVDVVTAAGGRAVLTDVDHRSGTDRIAEVAAAEGWSDDDIVVNLQGDEPCMPSDLVALVARALTQRPTVGIATLATPITTIDDVFDPNVVKVVLDDAGIARYFSRAPIPFARDLFGGGAELPTELPEQPTYLRHLGLYAYRVGTLRRVSVAAPCPAEAAESLEQLRALHLGIHIHVSIVDDPPGHGVDTEADLARVERELSR